MAWAASTAACLEQPLAEPGEDDTGPEDPLAEASLALAGIVGASVQGRVALGTRAGAQVYRLETGATQEPSDPSPDRAEHLLHLRIVRRTVPPARGQAVTVRGAADCG